MKERTLEDQKIIIRHSPVELLEHWALALSGFLLIFSGFGELPMYKRFMVTQIPGLAWAGDFFINLKIHYLAGIVFVSVMIFHALYHGWLGHQGLLPKKGDVKASIKTVLALFGFGEEPKSHKYLPEQRLAYAYLGGVGLVLVLTGAFKVIKNLPGVHLSPALITSMTLTHTFATIFFLLGVLAHLAALIFKVNRPLAKSIFTGEVDLEYIKNRHAHWHEELLKHQGEGRPEATAAAKDEVEEEAQAEVEAKEIVGEAGEERMEEDPVATILKVKGMSCQHCVMSITKAVSQVEGVQNVQVDLAKGEVRFDNSRGVASDQIEKAIVDAGYEVVHLEP